jgi:hypothetical protein
MLFFEFFPAFVALVSVIVGIMLWRADKRAQTGPYAEAPRQRVSPPNAANPQDDGRPVGRPSIRA